jgi:Xaa-Pro dipeptidase
VNEPGLAALDSGGPVDYTRLRRERTERTVLEMERADLDALVLGREANARYVSGARRLWTVGTRPFAPTCVLVRAPYSIHLLSTWDDGIPPEIPREHLIQLTWNPVNLIGAISRIEGLDACRRIGIDGMTPMFATLLGQAFPKAEWADGAAVLSRARSLKTPEEIACLRTATAIAEGALAAMQDEIVPGADPFRLSGRYAEEAARLGTPIPAFEACFVALRTGDGGAPVFRRVRTRHRLEAGDRVACQGGVIHSGYEGAVGRTLVCDRAGAAPPPDALAERLTRLRVALVDACRPGASAASLLETYSKCGEARPGVPVLHGVGLGVEPPIVDGRCSSGEAKLEAGMVVALHAEVWSEGAGAFARDTLLLTRDGSELLNAVPALEPGPR